MILFETSVLLSRAFWCVALGADNDYLNWLAARRVFNFIGPCPEYVTILDIKQSIMWVVADEFQYRRELSMASAQFMEISMLCSRLIDKHLASVDQRVSEHLVWGENDENIYRVQLDEIKLLAISAYKSDPKIMDVFESAIRQRVKIYLSYFGYIDFPDINYAIFSDKFWSRSDEKPSTVEVKKVMLCSASESTSSLASPSAGIFSPNVLI